MNSPLRVHSPRSRSPQFLGSRWLKKGLTVGALLGAGPFMSLGCGGSNNAGSSDNPGVTTGSGSAANASGGMNSGNTNGSGASTSAGGSSSVGQCGRANGVCTAPMVRTTEIDVGVQVQPYGGEGDTEKLPMAIAALKNGGSRIAWLGTDDKVYIGELDCDDHLVGTPFSIPAIDLQDLHADESGGVVLVTRAATGSGDDKCGVGPLCGGSSSPCYNMFLVRFDNSGNEVWATPVTNAIDGLDPYEDGARFVWWYQHHGRIAFDGTNYAAYFGTGITVQNGACIDIHEGDRLQVVSNTGSLVAGHPDAMEVGCSHAWQSRVVWDPRSSHFVAVCVTDNDCRIARPSPYRTVAQGACDGTLFGGDLVLGKESGYWYAWSQGGQIRLDHFTEAASDISIENAGPSSHPHLVSYGPDHMLLTWGTDGGMAAQVRDAATGATVGSEFSIAANDHNFQAFKSYEDGSVAYPASGSSGTKINIARVMPCQ